LNSTIYALSCRLHFKKGIVIQMSKNTNTNGVKSENFDQTFEAVKDLNNKYSIIKHNDLENYTLQVQKYFNTLEYRCGYMEKEIEKAMPRLEEIKENELINEGNKAEIMDTLYYITKYFEKEASTIEGRDDLFVLEDNITNNLLDRMNSLVSKQKEIIEFFKYN